MNGLVIAVCVVWSLVFSAPAWAQPSAGVATLVFTHVTVIDATGAPAQPDMTVVLQNDRIQAAGKTGAIPIPPAAQARIVDASGKFLIPGLWDMHTHVAFLKTWPGGRDSFLPLLIANGVTGVRDMGGDLTSLIQWRQEVSSGERVGPRIAATGRMLDGPEPPFPQSLAIANPEDGRRAVQDLKQRGADFIKVQSLIPRDAYFAVVAEARQQGLPVAGHVPDQITAIEVAEAGQRSIEHPMGLLRSSSTEVEALTQELSLFDLYISAKKSGPQRVLDSFSAQKANTLFASLASHGTWYCPTYIWMRGRWHIDEDSYQDDPRLQYIPARTVQSWRGYRAALLKDRSADAIATGKEFFRRQLELTQGLHHAGVRILAGTDSPAPYVFPGSSLHEELALLVEAGLTPMEALQTATRNPAEYLGQLDQLGTIHAGKLADLVLLDENPLADIRNSQTISAVIVGGRLFAQEALQALRAGAAEAAQQVESIEDEIAHD